MESLKKRTILVVNDELLIRQTIHLLLELENHHVLEASCGIEAVTLLSENHVDLVISDVRIPRGDGLFLLQELKKLQSRPIPPLVFMTGFADIDEYSIAAMGAAGLIRKPFIMDSLLDVIRSLLSSSAA